MMLQNSSAEAIGPLVTASEQESRNSQGSIFGDVSVKDNSCVIAGINLSYNGLSSLGKLNSIEPILSSKYHRR